MKLFKNKKGFTLIKRLYDREQGFTLIELLVVIAVLGTLAVVVLIAINPVQQLARARDAGRASAVAQMGHGIEAYATVNNGVYPTDGATCALANTWITGCLVTPGELQTAPAAVLYSSITGGASPTACGGVIQNGWCYDGGGTGAVIYAGAEATSNRSKCVAPTPQAYYVYSSVAGRGGLWCGNAAPTITTTTTGWAP